MLDAPLEEVREATLAFLLPPLERNGYPLHEQGPDVLVFGHGFRGARIMVRFPTSAIAARSSWCTAPRLSPSVRRSPGWMTDKRYFSNLDRRRSFSTRPPVCSSGQ